MFTEAKLKEFYQTTDQVTGEITRLQFSYIITDAEIETEKTDSVVLQGEELKILTDKYGNDATGVMEIIKSKIRESYRVFAKEHGTDKETITATTPEKIIEILGSNTITDIKET